MLEKLPYLDSCAVFDDPIRIERVVGDVVTSRVAHNLADGDEVFVSGLGLGQGQSFVVDVTGAMTFRLTRLEGGALGFEPDMAWKKQSVFQVGHLANQKVGVRADNEVYRDLVVEPTGRLELPRSAGRVVIGTLYDSVVDAHEMTGLVSEEGSVWGLRRLVQGFVEVFGFPGILRLRSGGSGNPDSPAAGRADIVSAKLNPVWRRRVGMRVTHSDPSYVAILSVGGAVEESSIPTAGTKL